MKKNLRIAAGLLVAAAVAVPATAVAGIAAYQPAQGTDQTGDVVNRKGNTVERPTLDLTSYVAVRDDSTFTFTTTYDDLVRTPYTRHLVFLSNDFSADQEGTIIEARTGRRGNTAVSVYAAESKGGETTRLEEISCPGAKVTLDYADDVATYVLPASCYVGANDPGGVFVTQGAQWTSARWQKGPLTKDITPANVYDSAYNFWQWSTTSGQRPSSGTPHFIF